LAHTARLGGTTAVIAADKAGIIKQDATVILAQQPVDAAQVLLKKAVEVDATVAREGLEFGVVARQVAVGGQLLTLRGLGGEYSGVYLPLHGAYQAHNASVALAAVEAFFGVGSQRPEPLDIDTVRKAFAGVSSPGRLEVVRRSPTVVLDAAHNPAGARATAEAVGEAFDFSRLIGVVGASADKNVRGLLEAFEPVFAEVVITQNTSHRAMDADELAAIAVEVFGEDRVQVEPRLPDALEAAITLAEEEGEFAGGGVLVTGSVITVGEARLLLGRG
ncbi:bifunctional folylpolyglutamate synthase/dihydrofolate synthase, partial [Streptomyces sp. NPDC127079]|uniref:bifunctional folylpolyglutamate synthase/dihydrofolate synthase n=1 Tax=Streptomyces sp. NPDC127079 TaxID=3347132 RepID=UPI0036632E1B